MEAKDINNIDDLLEVLAEEELLAYDLIVVKNEDRELTLKNAQGLEVVIDAQIAEDKVWFINMKVSEKSTFCTLDTQYSNSTSISFENLNYLNSIDLFIHGDLQEVRLCILAKDLIDWLREEFMMSYA